MADFFPLQKVKETVNNDKEFKITARFWSCHIRFRVGSEFYFMDIKEGVVKEFYRGESGFDPYNIEIGGASEDWKEMMNQPAKPFYHDWFAASFHHDFYLGGDLESAYAYYYALRRIHACMADCLSNAA